MVEPATAILLVHGIGSQRIGETAAKLTDGLRRAYPNVEADMYEGSGTVRLGDRTLHVYEVWWADLLDGDAVRGSFNPLSLHVLAWLPWLNWRAGVIPRRRLAAVVWTGVLAPLVLLIQLAYFVSMLSARARRLFDERVADVLNYVDSADHDLDDTSPLADVSERIEARVSARLGEAVAAGAEDVVVVAHSLGSVIAYRTLMRGLSDGGDTPWTRVSTLVTIGSPLNTFSLVWPRLVAPVGGAPVPKVRWHNVHDRLDPIAGGVRHVRAFSEPVREHVVFGRSGFAFAHTSYEKHPVFLKVLSERLMGSPPKLPVPLAERAGLLARSVGECLAVIAGALAVLVIGAAIALVIGAVVALVFAVIVVAGTMIENLALWKDSGLTFAGSVRGVFAVLMVLAFVVLPLVFGRVTARKRHYAHVHNVRADVTGVGEDVPEPPGWLAGIGALAGAAVGVTLIVTMWADGGMPNAWDPGVALIARAFLGFGYALAGLFGVWMGLVVLFGLHWCWQAWRQWRAATGRADVPGA